ncbi:MAG TPA: carbohydrate kinase family protein [Candidatus Merdenecus merdavium]|nr:carbohydrate kinase family protein [Candidatus Merdenecus merdavium]
MKGKGIVIAGSLICDNFYMIDTYPEIGRLTNVRGVHRGVGGTGNIIIDLAKLDFDLEVKVSGVIGTGSNGRFIKQTLQKYPNIDLQHLVEEGDTSMTIVMEAQDNKQRTFFYQAAGSDVYDESYIDWDHLEADIFHLEYLLLLKKVDEEDPVYGTHGAKILHDAKARGMKTSIDIVSEESDRAKKIVGAALKYTDYCTVNEIEAQEITGVELLKDGQIIEKNVKKALLKLKELGVSTWAIIHSPSWGYGLDCKSGEIVQVPSLKLPKGYIKSTTGAGDAFCAGVLYSAYENQTLTEALKLGAACAACSLSEVGGSAGLRSYELVQKEYDKYKVE